LVSLRENDMSNHGVHREVRTIALSWRTVCAALPATALIAGGIAMAAPAGDVKSVPISRSSAAITVPDTALTMPPVPGGSGTQEAPGLVLSKGTAAGNSSLVALDSSGIPIRALEAYHQAASLVNAADPACHIDWALLGAIGRVESNHGRYGGSQLDSAGVDQPAVYGVPLNGLNGTTLITDTGGNVLDGSGGFARAEGPMQFIPSTWRVVGVDANGDGVKNPQEMADAATSAAVYLCSGKGDLRRPGGLRAAIMRYNPSDAYVRTVTSIADAYRHGVSALPASDLPAASPAPSKAGTANATTENAKPARNRPAPRSSPPAGQKPSVTPQAPATSPPTSPPPPIPALPLPALPVSLRGPIPSGLPSQPLSHEVCTVSTLGVMTCRSPR
jgi:Transglycosylase SLT domain